MKTQEEKAKAYDEALKQIKECTPDENGFVTIYPQEIFPELKESEDAMIRKEICKLLWDNAPYEEAQKYITWLEKQGEQKPQGKTALEAIKEEKVDNTNKVEPKFKAGDWIINNNDDVLYIDKVIANISYNMTSDTGIFYRRDFHYIDKEYRLWTIQDAEDGDVLVHNDCTFIFMGIKDGIVQALEENLLDGTNPVPFGEPDKDNDYCPATKEQRDTLMKAIADAGYTFDFDKKELKKIEQKSTENEELTEFDKAVGVSIGTWNPKTQEQIQSVKAVSKKLLKLAKKQINDEQKPAECKEKKYSKCYVYNLPHNDEMCEQCEFNPKNKKLAEWSEEDERKIGDICDAITLDDELEESYKEELYDFLKSFRPQKYLIPSEEEIEKAAQEWNSKAIFKPFYMSRTGIEQDITTHKESFKAGLSWILKFLKDRVQPQPQQEWSKKDERIILAISQLLKDCESENGWNCVYYNDKEVFFVDMENWLKSIKPQNRWKPSDKQMKVLTAISSKEILSGYERGMLVGLYTELQKLREE